VDFATDNEDSL